MFSVTDAAFTGFRVVRNHPAMVLWWTLANLVLSVFSVVVMVSLAGTALRDIQMIDQANPDMALLLDAYARLAPAYLILLVVSLLYYGVLYAAANRAVFSPQDSRFGYLRFGGAEIQQVLLMLVVGLLIFGVYIAAAIVGGIVMAILSMGGGAAGAAIGVFLMIAIIFSTLAFFSVKLSLSSAQTFRTGKFNIFGSWALTKGRFWPILGVYLIAGILMLIVYALILGVFAGIVFASGGMPALMGVFAPDTTSFAGFLQPATVAYYVLVAGVGAMTLPVWLTPGAWIYNQIAQPSAADVFG